ncbi:MAG: glucuronate isomerase [Clostridia bacterium]|nr:glucuronate isomerase [Clostridia bacterium]
MKENYLLKTEQAQRLYSNTAKNLPIIDFHNHITLKDIVNDRKFNNIYELWLECDPYKHRLMRICGIPEFFITGGAEPYEKFKKYCEIFPHLAGNPVYDWSRMELSSIFGINELPCRENAKKIFDATGEMLSSSEYTNNAILSRFNIEYQSPVASILDELSDFDGKKTAPSLRGDELLLPTEKLKNDLSTASDIKITDDDSYTNAICKLLDRFEKADCKFADHALDDGFFEEDSKKQEILIRLGNEYAKRGWTLLLHLDAKRKTSSRLRAIAGAAGGYAASGGRFDTSALCDLLGKMEDSGALPRTVLFPLTMSDQTTLAILEGSFSEDGIKGKIQLGPAWWWCDHSFGIKNALDSIASFGVLSEFIGMTTDSRSILSFVRHDYFRRIFCSYLDELNSKNELDMTYETMTEIVEKVCYKNAYERIKKNEKI